MYDELIKNLRGRSQFLLPHYGEETSYDSDLMKQAADAIEELTRENESLAKSVNEASEILRRRWIHVTERLPKMLDGENISKEVYVTDGTEIAKACIMRDYEGATSWTYAGIGKITHWCEQIPLPQPPKGEN